MRCEIIVLGSRRSLRCGSPTVYVAIDKERRLVLFKLKRVGMVQASLMTPNLVVFDPANLCKSILGEGCHPFCWLHVLEKQAVFGGPYGSEDLREHASHLTEPRLRRASIIIDHVL